jgi:hypothetical protein
MCGVCETPGPAWQRPEEENGAGRLRRDGLGWKCCRNGLAWRDTAREDFSILEFFFHLFFKQVRKK